jgi:hypothetical protein
MPFLGAETALGCVGGRRADLPVLGVRGKTGGISAERDSGRDLGWVLPACGRLEECPRAKTGSPSQPRFLAVFRRNGIDKVQVWLQLLLFCPAITKSDKEATN